MYCLETTCVCTDTLSQAKTHKPNETVAVTLFWQVENSPDVDHTVFVHLLDSSDQLVAQLDRPAGSFASPTSTWHKGQAWRDSYPVLLPPGLPDGVYTLHIGMYNWPSLERLPISETDKDSWKLGEIHVDTNR